MRKFIVYGIVFGFLAFGFRYGLKPAAKFGKKAAHVAYKVAV